LKISVNEIWHNAGNTLDGRRNWEAWRNGMRNGKLGGHGVTEEEFLRIMRSLEAVAKSEWTSYNIYDPVAGELLEAYQDWLKVDGKVAGRVEQYYWHGEQQYLYVVL
jgi:hypothetical protein